MKTSRQRRVMRKAIKMAKAGQLDVAHARYLRLFNALNGLPRRSRAFNVAMTRARRALDLLALIEGVRLHPAELAWIQAIYRGYRHEDKRRARRA